MIRKLNVGIVEIFVRNGQNFESVSETIQLKKGTVQGVIKTTVPVLVEATVVDKEYSRATTTTITRLLKNNTGEKITTRAIKNVCQGFYRS